MHAAGERHKLSIAWRMFYVVKLKGFRNVKERYRQSYMNIRKIGALLLLLVFPGLMSGCGNDEAVHTSAQADGVEEIQIQEVPSEEEPMSSEDEGEIGQTETEDTFVVEEITVEEPLKSQLTAELLEENDLDASVVENSRVTKGCTFTLPEGFEPSEDVEGMYVTGRYPIDASTIYYAQLEQDMALQLMTKEMFQEQTQESLREMYGEGVEVVVDSFEQITMQGYPAFKILCHYQAEDVKVTQLEYAINADKNYVIIYSQTSDYDRMEEYEASAETIRVE